MPPTPASQGRTAAMVVVVVVTAAWTMMATRGEIRFEGPWSNDPVPPAVFILTGFYIGLPLALVCGTIVGKLAGRTRDARWRVHVASITCTLVVALVPIVLLQSAASALPMAIVALAIAAPASVILERATRPDEMLAHARLA
ncbi:MAG TPA: hypothetical protein VH143_12455 [Kofleriaceae bacterium]|nr:hypothetical protein [Kofleriaceae bacterium]